MATIQDVARLAGVSTSTVSFALNNSRPVAPKTRERIEQAMAELGFRRNALARGLASHRTRIVALALPIGRTGLSSTIDDFIDGASGAARTHGHHLVLWPIGHTEGDEIVNLCRQSLADGVVLMDVHLSDARVTALQDEGLPFVLIGRTADDAVPHVDIDFAATAEASLRLLADLGHRDIGFINHSEASAQAGYGPAVRIRDAFAQLAPEHAMRCDQRYCDESAEAGRATTLDLLRAHPDVTAIVVMNDDASFGVLQALRELDLRVPEDVSVLSIVSSPINSALTFPKLTALLSPGAELGRLGTDSLIARLNGEAPPARDVLIPCALQPGDSTAPRRA